jgi:acyl-CoA hydrolase
MIVGIRVEALYPKSGIISHTNSSYFTMVAKNDANETDVVPGLILENETEIRRFYEGLHLKIMSKQKREMLNSDFSHLSVDEITNLLLNEKCQVAF